VTKGKEERAKDYLEQMKGLTLDDLVSSSKIRRDDDPFKSPESRKKRIVQSIRNQSLALSGENQFATTTQNFAES
jgi:hypothetical protein